jgi:glycosyltransferase involved in cell wall biosynthesis
VLEGLKKFDIHIDLFNVGVGSSPLAKRKVFQSLKETSKQYDLVHAQYGSLTGFLTAQLPNPKILTLRGSDWHQYVGSDLRETAHAFLAVSMSKAALRRFDKVIVMSDRMKKELQRRAPGSEPAVIPDPIDLDIFSPLERTQCRRDYHHSNSDAPWVLFNTISRTNPVKRLALAEEAIKIARRTIPAIELKIATGIAYTDMRYWINACDVALCTSTHEGWPNSIKEAIACNVPFVSTDVSDLADIAGKSSNCAVVADDPQAIADALLQAIAKPHDKDLRSHVMDFNEKNTALMYIQLYREALAGHGQSVLA